MYGGVEFIKMEGFTRQTSLQLPCGLLLLPTSEKLTWEGASQIDWYSQPIQYKLHTFIFHHLQLNHLNLLDIT